jgi:endonuclease/exonuclease/phosphatase family metal-dependent hydrolase
MTARIAVRFPMFFANPRRLGMADEEPLAAVIASLATPSGALTVATTHLSFVPGWNRLQLRRLSRDLRGFPGPRLLCGDLKYDGCPGATLEGPARALDTAATFPSQSPEHQVDHVLTDDPTLTLRQCQAPLMPISGHRPLVVDVERRRD